MVFDNVYPSHQVIPSLEEKYGCRFAIVPLMDCAAYTSYLVSHTGEHAFVCADFGGYCQVKEITIYPAGIRSKNSTPYFRRRNARGSQIAVLLSSAVYGAFTLGEYPKRRLTFIDGNPNNCHIDNLVIAEDPVLEKNAILLADIYASKYDIMIIRIRRYCRKLSQAQAEDYVSDSFMRLLESRTPIDLSKVVGLWMRFAIEGFLKYSTRNRILFYDIHEIFQNIDVGEYTDEGARFQSIMAMIPNECKKAVELTLSGYSQTEIGKLLGCSQQWVGTLLTKARKILRNYDK